MAGVECRRCGLYWPDGVLGKCTTCGELVTRVSEPPPPKPTPLPTPRKPSGGHGRRFMYVETRRIEHHGMLLAVCDVWSDNDVVVLSSLDSVDWQGNPTSPQWHVSATRRLKDRRVSNKELRRVRKAFGMKDAEEDNHEPGLARHLWMPVAVDERVDCECKEDEATLVEADGHTWQAPADEDHETKRDDWAEFRKSAGAEF